MTIYVPKPLAILFLVVFGGGALALLIKETPDLIRYAKFEGM